MSAKIYALVGLLGMGLIIIWHFIMCSEWKGILYKIFTILLVLMAAVPFFIPIFDRNIVRDFLNWAKTLRW